MDERSQYLIQFDSYWPFNHEESVTKDAKKN